MPDYAVLRCNGYGQPSLPHFFHYTINSVSCTNIIFQASVGVSKIHFFGFLSFGLLFYLSRSFPKEAGGGLPAYGAAQHLPAVYPPPDRSFTLYPPGLMLSARRLFRLPAPYALGASGAFSGFSPNSRAITMPMKKQMTASMIHRTLIFAYRSFPIRITTGLAITMPRMPQ